MSEITCDYCKILYCECVPGTVECDSCRRAYEQGSDEAVEKFAKWLEKNDYLNAVELDYDYEENSYETTIGLSAEQVVAGYREGAENE